MRSCYPSIFNENIYIDLIKKLKDIVNNLLNKTVINVEIHEYIIDYLTNSNNFETWKDMYSKCVYILCNYITRIRNEESPIYYLNIDEFNDSVNLQETPINQFPYRDYDDEYIEFVEVLFSYYHNENEIVFPSNSLFEDSDEESDDDNNINYHPLINKYSLISNDTDVECNICFHDTNINYYKCDTCIFKICLDCYNKYNKNNCPMCRQ